MATQCCGCAMSDGAISGEVVIFPVQSACIRRSPPNASTVRLGAAMAAQCSAESVGAISGEAVIFPVQNASIWRSPPVAARLSAFPAIFCAASLPLSGCPHMPLVIGTSAVAQAHRSIPPRASTKTRFRRWATPKYRESNMRQAAARAGPETIPAPLHLPPGGCAAD